MNKLIFTFLLISLEAFATSPIQDVVLSSEQAKKLGFIILVKDSISTGDTIFTITGPSVLGNNCKPGQVGKWLFSSDNVLIDANLVRFKAGESEHGVKFSSLYFDTGNNVQFFFDYFCQTPWESRRYVFKFKNRKLITSQ